MTDRPVPDAKAFTAAKLALADIVRHDGALSASSRLIGAEICSLANERTGYSWASERYLAEKLSVADRTIKRAIVALKAAGYIEVTKAGRNNRYRPLFGALEKGTKCPLSEADRGHQSPLSDENRGQKEPQQGTFSSENRGQKGPPISLEISLGISSRPPASANGAAASAVGAGPTASSPDFDLGLPGVALRQRLGDDVFRSWLGRVGFAGVIGDELVLTAPTRFVAQHLSNNFETAILAAFRVAHASVARLRVEVAPQAVTALRGARKGPEDPDARWLVDIGIAMVAERMRLPRDQADRMLVGWLKRSGRDAAGLRRIIEEASAQDLVEAQFANVLKQRTKALLFSDQVAMEFLRRPQAVKRRVS